MMRSRPTWMRATPLIVPRRRECLDIEGTSAVVVGTKPPPGNHRGLRVSGRRAANPFALPRKSLVGLVLRRHEDQAHIFIAADDRGPALDDTRAPGAGSSR